MTSLPARPAPGERPLIADGTSASTVVVFYHSINPVWLVGWLGSIFQPNHMTQKSPKN